MTSKLIPIKEVCSRIGLSRTWIYHRMADGDRTFPQPVKVGERRVLFVESEIQDWIAAQISERVREAA